MVREALPLRTLVSAIGLAGRYPDRRCGARSATSAWATPRPTAPTRLERRSECPVRCEIHLFTSNVFWQFQHVRLAEMLGQAGGQNDKLRKRVVDSEGKLAFDERISIAAPAMTRTSPIVVSGDTVGRVEIETSLRSLLAETGVVAAFSILIGLGVFFAVRVFPIRVLDQTLGALEKTNQRFDAALNNMSPGPHHVGRGRADRRLQRPVYRDVRSFA